MKAFLSVLLVFATIHAEAAFEATNKFKLKSNNQIYDGYERDGMVHLYNYAQRLRPTPVAPNQVIYSTRAAVDGIRAGHVVLVRTAISPYAICTVETVFVDKQLAVFCDESALVKNQPVPTRTHYRPMTHQVLAEQSGFNGITKDKVYELNSDTISFRRGQKIRAVHVYANGLVLVEPSPRKLLNRVLPENMELISAQLLK